MIRTSFILCLAVCSSTLQANDWARFRGPAGAGSTSTAAPTSWTPSANLAWKSPLPGPGVSSPIVVGDRVFITCYSGYGIERNEPGEIENLKRHVLCFDAQTGEQMWQADVPAVLPEDPYSGIGVTAHGYASHTPVSDGENLFVFFGKSGALAFDFNGNQLWQTSVGNESDPWAWGSSSSPIVYGDLLIVTASAESQALVGLDKSSGEEVWRQEAAGLDGMWGTPILVKVDDRRTDLVLGVAKEIWGLNPEDGKLRWYCQASGAEQAHASVIAGGGIVFAFSGRGGGSIAVTAGGSGDVTESHVLWNGNDTSSFGSPVGHKSQVYLVAGGIVSAFDGRSGQRLGRTRLEGGSSSGGGFGRRDYPSPVIAGDKLYYLNGAGQMFVLQLGGELEQLSVNLVTSEEESFGGTPAISNGRIFIRSNKHLYCVADSGQDVPLNASAALLAKNSPVEENASREGQARAGFGRGPGGSGSGGQQGGPGGRGGFDPSAIFKGRDQNQDGKLTTDELEGSSMAERLDSMDKDGDKALSMEEFQNGIRSMFGGGRGGRGFGGPEREDNRPERPQRPQAESR